MTQTHEPKATGLTGRVVLAAVFAVASLAVLAVFIWAFQPKQMPPYAPPHTDYDLQAMLDAVSVESVEKINREILAGGDRFVGKPGHVKARQLVLDRYREAGLEVIEQGFSNVVPVTKVREIRDEAGEPLGDVEIYPFLPNHVQPIVTPEEGLSARVRLVDEEVLASGAGFKDCFALVDMKDAPPTYSVKWYKYAVLGFKGVIISHSDGLDQINWGSTELQQLCSTIPVNYPRVLATPEIFDHADQVVNIRVESRYEYNDNSNVIGVLKAGKLEDNEAFIIFANYDARSYTPDLSRGPMMSVSLATQLALLEGLKAYQDELRRDIIFVALGAQSLGQVDIVRFAGTAGRVTDMSAGPAMHREFLEEHEEGLELCSEILPLFEDPAFCVEPERSEEMIDQLGDAARSFLDDQLRYIMNDRLAQLQEPTLQARLEFIRAGEDDDSPEFDEFLAAKQRQQRVLMIAGYGLARALRTLAEPDNEELRDLVDLRQRALDRFTTLQEYHRRQAEREKTNIRIGEMLGRYSNLIAMNPRLVPKLADKENTQEAVGLCLGPAGGGNWGKYWQSRAASIDEVVRRVVRRDDREKLDYRQYTNLKDAKSMYPSFGGSNALASHWTSYGYTMLQPVNLNRQDSYNRVALPVVVPEARDLRDLNETLRLVGQIALSFGFGNGSIPFETIHNPATYAGEVYLSGIGRSIVPNHPYADALVTGREHKVFVDKGGIGRIMLWTNPYGKYMLPLNLGGFSSSSRKGIKGYSPVAIGYDSRGRITHMKDVGPDAQSMFDSVDRQSKGPSTREVNIVVFRAEPTAILDMVNPQTFKAFSGVEWISREGLTPFPSFCRFEATEGYWMNFLPADERFYVQLKAGSPENELVQEVRAFMLGIPPGWEQPESSTREIDGPGYLTADTPIIQDVPFEIARSMLWLNERRLELQKKYDMHDERMVAYHKRAEEVLSRATEPGLSKREQNLRASEASTYAMLNHPPLKENIREAVMSIIWYLCLLVPFGFFFEKLLFGFTDVRKQIAAQGVIFVSAFLILRLLHPAFAMIRSSLMILLGFIIILISSGITLLFSGKFKENFEQLKAQRGQVSAAEVNMMGVVGTAFMLGLNNMHRRKVRTGLTCATLVLITFAMICFTSTQSDVVDTEVAIGKAPYQGLLIKEDDLRPISDDEIFAFNQEYGRDYIVSKRQMLVALNDRNTSTTVTPNIKVAIPRGEGPDAREVSVRPRSVMVFDERDPLSSQIPFVTRGGDPEANWFPEGSRKAKIKPLILPESMATDLQITPQMVEESEVIVELNSKKFYVHSLFDAKAYEAVLGLDGKPLLPLDVESIRGGFQYDKQQNVLAVEPFGYIAPENIVIGVDFSGVSWGQGITSKQMELRTASAVIWLVDKQTGRKTPYREAHEVIQSFLEQTGRQTYYGLDGVAYRGQRTRQTSLAGAMDMLIPLIIAALTVLNTIRGSVYERRDEIFVYNAVGIAPRYVFFMFFAEAFVYAVVGSVLGYFLSQGTGRTLTMLNMTGGLNMTFTTSTTIYASLAIMAATFLSTLFPALKAMDIAAPAEESGWDVPEPDGDELVIDLPFTFDIRDRLAVLEFFDRFFLEHGEGSSGAFYCSRPEMGVRDEPDELAQGAYVPELRTTVWLKPFDLGVSQQLSIALPTDPQTNEYIAHLVLHRLSGTRESWLRLNYRFLKRVRKHFLHWRAVSTQEREDMFQKARDQIREHLNAREVRNG